MNIKRDILFKIYISFILLNCVVDHDDAGGARQVAVAGGDGATAKRFNGECSNQGFSAIHLHCFVQQTFIIAITIALAIHFM